MNYLEALPVDVIKIINREVQKEHITKRRIERKQNRKINIDQREKAERKRCIYEQYARLYNKYIEYQQEMEYSQRIDKHYEHTKRLYNEVLKKYGECVLDIVQCVGDDEPYVSATLCIDGKILYSNFK
jgi:hypothetical protein